MYKYQTLLKMYHHTNRSVKKLPPTISFLFCDNVSITEYIAANGRTLYDWIGRDLEGDDSGLLEGLFGFYRFQVFNSEIS
jgi:hypothetical protein